MRTPLSSLLLVAMLAAGSARAAEPVATVIALKGRAVALHASGVEELAVGSALAEGAEVKTGTPGRVKLRFVDASVMVIGDGSRLVIERLRADKASGRREAQFILDIGLVSQQVAPARSGAWSVRTPTAVTAVRGTEYLIEVRDDLATEVDIRSGVVAVEPARQAGELRMRSTRPTGYAGDPTPVILDRAMQGTTCGLDGVCEARRGAGAERLRELEARLSGF